MKGAAAVMAERRRIARENGQCIVCCKRNAQQHRTACKECTRKIIAHQKRRRSLLRQRTNLEHIIEAHERMGDKSQEHHLYTEAAQWYNKALAIREINDIERRRVTEKLARAYFLGDNPSAATPLIKWLLSAYIAMPGGTEKAAEALISLASQFYIEFKFEQTVPILSRAVTLAQEAGLIQLETKAKLDLVRSLWALERPEQMLSLLNEIGEPSDPWLRLLTFSYLGHAEATLGNETKAYTYFDRALELADEERTPSVYGAYGAVTLEFGNIELARRSWELAILVAREQQVSWRLACVYVDYSNFLAIMGKYDTAREYLLRGFAYETQAPFATYTRVRYGISLALQINDAELLSQCENSQILDLVFRSGNPSSICAMAGAFAQLYAMRGRRQKAQALLRRALRHVQRLIIDAWEFPVIVARYGFYDDIAYARRLYDFRLGLPNNRIPFAWRTLFDATVAKREKQTEEARKLARSAELQFEKVQWHRSAQIARSILGEAPVKSEPDYQNDHMPMSIASTLTLREREVAGLALRGFTNRAIATQLEITENTVEKHMSAIIGRLGVRSRHQLAEMLKQSQMEAPTTDSVMCASIVPAKI